MILKSVDAMKILCVSISRDCQTKKGWKQTKKAVNNIFFYYSIVQSNTLQEVRLKFQI